MDSFECIEGEVNLHGRVVGVYDAAGNPTGLPAPPVWGSNDLRVVVPHGERDGMSAWLEVKGHGECTIYVDTGISDTPSTLVQGRCDLTVLPAPGEARRVVIELFIA